MRFSRVASVAVAAVLFADVISCALRQPVGTDGSAVAAEGAQSGAVVERMLTDRRLWGEDAFAAFASIDAWQALGYSSITVYPDKVAAGLPAKSPDEAKRTADRLTASVGRRPRRLRPEVATEYAAALAAKRPKMKATVQRFREDDSIRPILTREGGEFLRKGVTMRVVKEAYGPPEKTTTEVIHAEGERRPAILTIHHYANGAVKFVQSDLSPTPGVVDRVLLDVPTVEKALTR